jgi:seryl-tRNA synthetase
MLDIKFIRENKDLVAAGAKKKNINFDIEELIKIDEKRREIMARAEAKRAEQNAANDKIASTKSADERAAFIAEMKKVKEDFDKEDAALKEVMKQWQSLMLKVPNIPDISVPDGKSALDNKEVRAWGDKPKFSFKPKTHIELMEMHDLADFERGTKVAGFRGYFLKNEAAIISHALWDLALKMLVKKGFTPMIVPSQVKKEMLLGTGYLPHGEEDLYHNQDNEYYAGTGEVATMGYYSDEIIPVEKLPIKIAAFSTCFRREAGSHGKDTKGLIRVHEFYKVEQLILAEASHESTVALHEDLTKNAEELLQALHLPYHVLALCGADMGLPHVKTYDIETWIPSENNYRETHSSSYYHDFQARRMGIRYADTDGKKKYVYSLNNTAVATPRIIAAIVENNQQEDGSIVVPEILRSYLGKDVIGKDVIK